jgi:hypothetical protein
MKPDRHPLLRDLLDDAATPARSAAALTHTLAAVRARRRRKVAARWAGALVVLLLAGLAIRPGVPGKEPGGAAIQSLVITDDNAALLSPAPAKAVHFLTDEELLARFPDRPVALIGSGPKQQLVFLDAPVSPRAEAER